MKALACAVLDVGSMFVVDIDSRKRVSDLQQEIKEMNPSVVTCDAAQLTLYVAKKDGDWLRSNDPEVVLLKKGEVPDGMYDLMEKEMNPLDRLENTAFDFPDDDDAKEGEIHVLVAMPGQVRAAATATTTTQNKAPHPTRKRRWDALNNILDKNKKAKIQDGESTTGDSYVSFQDVNAVMPAARYEQATKHIDDAPLNVLYAYLLVVTKAFGEIASGNEAKRVHFIAPVLACVCALFNDDVKLLVEETVTGNRVHGDGKFSFVIQRGDKRVCIVEAKKDDMDQGLKQAYVGSEVLSDVEGVSTVYNVVTDYKSWDFSRITDETVEREETSLRIQQSIPTRDSVKTIAGKIYAMLSSDE